MNATTFSKPVYAESRVSGLERIAETVIGCIMLYSGLQHLANPYAFFRSVDNYQLLDPDLGYYLAFFLPILQVTLAFLLVLGVFREGSRLLVTALFLVYLAAQLSALFRGLDIECGCFGPSGSKISWWSIVLVATLVAVSFCLLFRSLARNK